MNRRMRDPEESSQTFYDLLEVNESAGPVDIYQAYQRAKATYAPNSPAIYSMFSPDEAKELMALIEEAYQVLSHQGRRKAYDQKLGIGPAQPTRSQSLPSASFQVSNSVRTESVALAPPRDELPEGFARTRFSIYEVKPEFEAQVSALEVCSGEMLQKIRLYKGVALEQIATEIRASKNMLVALEADDFEALPVAVFTRGFVVHYTRLLGLNENKIADAYMKHFRANKV